MISTRKAGQNAPSAGSARVQTKLNEQGTEPMLDLALLGFVGLLMLLGIKRPFIWVLAYIYIDIVAPQKIGWGIIQSLQISLIAFVAAFAGWLLLDSKAGSRITLRQGLIVALLGWCFITTLGADFPDSAWEKWGWVWKSLFFGAFLPLTLRTYLRIEAAALFMVLAAGSIIIPAGIKTLLSGGGYGTLASLVTDNTGLYEGSTLSTVAIAMIPLIMWVARNGTIFPKSWLTMGFGVALCFAALLVPIGTQTRTGLLCIALLAVLTLRSVRHRALFMAAGAGLLMLAVPFLPASYFERMSTITQHEGDQSASTRVAVWNWTIDYALENPLGGGFDAFLGNSFTYTTRTQTGEGGNVAVEYGEVTDKARAYHSAYFELLGEQGFVGLGLWLWLQGLGLWQMERIRRRLGKSTDPAAQRWRSLATALQHGQLVYLLGAAFIGVGYQPFMFMLLGLQIALASFVQHQVLPDEPKAKPWRKPAAAAVPAQASA